MKSFKKIASSVFTLLALCFLFANVVTVQAEDMVEGKVYVAPYTNVKGKIKNTTKMRVLTDEFHSFSVYYGAGDRIKNLKVNKKGLTAKVEYYFSDDSDNRDYGYSTIKLYGTKPGKYKVSFNVVDLAGKKIAKKSITVQLVHSDALIKKATFGKQTVVANTATFKKGTKKTVHKDNKKVKGTSGKLKITPNSQYKVTGILVRYVDKNGKYAYKKIKNGGTVTLSKTYTNVQKSTSSSSREPKKITNIYISYKDTFFGDTCKYTVVKNRGIKEVKYVYKNKKTGRTSVSYGASSNINLFQY